MKIIFMSERRIKLAALHITLHTLCNVLMTSTFCLFYRFLLLYSMYYRYVYRIPPISGFFFVYLAELICLLIYIGTYLIKLVALCRQGVGNICKYQ